MGDYRTAVTLAPGTSHRDDDAQGQGIKVNDAGPGPKVFSEISLVPGRQGHGFAAVHHGPAAHGEDDVGMMLSGQLGAFLDLGSLYRMGYGL